MRILVFILLLCSSCVKSQTGIAGFLTSGVTPLADLHEKFTPFGGTNRIVGTGNPGIWNPHTAENSMVKVGDSIRIYYSDILNYNENFVAVLTIPNMDVANFNSYKRYNNPIIGRGYGGAPSGRSASASCVVKDGSYYYAFALNGYGFPGEDRCIYAYRATDGYTFSDRGKMFDVGYHASIGVNVIGYGNTCFVQELNEAGEYVIKKIGGKYVGNVDIWNGTIWQTTRFEGDNIEGPFTLTTVCTTLQAASGKMYGSADWIYSGGLYYSFYHATPAVYEGFDGSDPNLPTIGYWATSADTYTWTIKDMFMPLDAQPFAQETDQFADPCVRQINGKTYLMASWQENETPLSSQLHLWTFDGTFQQLITP